MQLPWRSLHRPAARTISPAWPPTAATLLLALLAVGAATQWSLRRSDPGANDTLLADGALTLDTLRAGRGWTLLSHLFVNTGPTWLFPTTLLTFALAGRPLERIVGRHHLWSLFGLAGILGGLGQVGFDTLLGRQPPVAGASSAVLGVLLALTCVSPKAPLLPWVRSGALRRVQVIHGTLGALAATVAAGTQPPAAGALVGGLTGCLYMHALGFGSRAPQEATSVAPPTPSASSASWPPRPASRPPLLQNTPATRRFTEQEQQMTPREFIAARIDPILEKISREGLDSLTTEEHQLLEKAREKFHKQEIGPGRSN